MCRLIVEGIWGDHVGDSVFAKLAACSKALESWGKDITGNFYRRIGLCLQKIRALKGCTDPHSLIQYQEANKALFEALIQKEVFWRQRSKQLWLREGDHNSKFFHASARTRRRSNRIQSLRSEEGVQASWDNGLQELMINYFQTLFTPHCLLF